MPSTTIYQYHYLYRITNLVEQKHYYGIRTSKNITPHDDLGKKYFSSSVDKEFRKDQRLHPENYRYKIVAVSDSRQRILELEIKIHQKFNVGVNENFYNRSIQTSTGFDVSGKVSVCDDFGNTSQVSVDDSRITSGELFSIVKGKVPMIDSDGNYVSVDVNDPRIEGGELQYMFKGKTPMRDSDGNIHHVSINDPRIASGELVGICEGMRHIYNIELKKCRMLKPGETLPMGWEFGRLFFYRTQGGIKKGSRHIFNRDLKQNRVLKPGETLPMGWEFGRYNNKPTVPKGSIAIHSLELGKTRYITQSEEIPLGWDIGILPGKYIHNKALGLEKRIPINDPIPEGWEIGRMKTPCRGNKGNRCIFNSELKQNKQLKPGEILQEGWKFGQKRSWD